MEEFNELQKENEELSAEVEENDKIIDELSQKVTEMSSNGVAPSFLGIEGGVSWKTVLEREQHELALLKKKKLVLARSVNDQNLILKKQEEKIQNSPFNLQRLAFSRDFYHNKKGKHNREMEALSKELELVQKEIKQTKEEIKIKHKHVASIKEMANEIPKLREEIEQKGKESALLEEKRNNIRVLKARIADYQQFATTSPERATVDYSAISDMFKDLRNCNTKAIHEYSSKIESILNNQ